MKVPRGKVTFLFGIVFTYLAAAAIAFSMVQTGTLERMEPTPKEVVGIDVSFVPLPEVEARMEAAQSFVDTELVRSNGHVELYHVVTGEYPGWDDTNSEAMSYYLLWKAKEGDKEAFDNALSYIRIRMIHPTEGYLMWRLNTQGYAVRDGVNIASDADLRAIRALLIAEAKWGDRTYTETIDTLASGLENVAITDEGLLAPYGAAEFTADEIWLSYEDFQVFRELSVRRGEPWQGMYDGMERLTLRAQTEKGFYNSEVTPRGDFGNDIDGGGYGINSMWMMVRAAESGDPDLQASARESLDFYKQRFIIDAQLFSLYDANGNALAGYDSPWVYALVGRAAVALNDEAFADAMIGKLLEFQVFDESELHGAFPEGSEFDLRVGQFTMQESILTIQDYVAMKESFKE